MGEEMKVIVFGLANEEYGIEVEKVRTIERMIPITRVPKTFAFVKGVINLRGVVIPVIDLRGRFGLPESEPTESSRIIIVAVNELEVGFIVDSAASAGEFYKKIPAFKPKLVILDLQLPDEDGFGSGQAFAPPSGKVVVAAHRVLELRAVCLHRERHSAGPANRSAEQHVVREDQIGGHLCAQRRRIERDVAVSLGAREILQQLHLKPLVTV